MAFQQWARPAAALVLGCAACCAAQAITNPPIEMVQGIETMRGGRTADEAAFMQTVAPRWSAVLEFGVNRARRGDFPADMQVQVRERYTRKLVMQLRLSAPYLLARLDPGAYEVEATLGGVTLSQPLVVFHGQAARASFAWPSNVDFVRAGGGQPPEQQAAMKMPE